MNPKLVVVLLVIGITTAGCINKPGSQGDGNPLLSARYTQTGAASINLTYHGLEELSARGNHNVPLHKFTVEYDGMAPNRPWEFLFDADWRMVLHIYYQTLCYEDECLQSPIYSWRQSGGISEFGFGLPQRMDADGGLVIHSAMQPIKLAVTDTYDQERGTRIITFPKGLSGLPGYGEQEYHFRDGEVLPYRVKFEARSDGVNPARTYYWDQITLGGEISDGAGTWDFSQSPLGPSTQTYQWFAGEADEFEGTDHTFADFIQAVVAEYDEDPECLYSVAYGIEPHAEGEAGLLPAGIVLAKVDGYSALVRFISGSSTNEYVVRLESFYPDNSPPIRQLVVSAPEDGGRSHISCIEAKQGAKPVLALPTVRNQRPEFETGNLSTIRVTRESLAQESGRSSQEGQWEIGLTFKPLARPYQDGPTLSISIPDQLFFDAHTGYISHYNGPMTKFNW